MKLALKFLLAVALFAVAVPLGGAANAAVITSLNSDFEAEGATYGTTQLTFDDFNDWEVTSGSVDLVETPDYGIGCNPGFCVDTDGTATNIVSGAGTLQTKNEFAAGTYKVKFDISGNQRGSSPDTLTLIFGAFTELFTKGPNDPFTTIIRTITVGSGTEKLKFAAGGGDNIGIILDNVSVSAVPVPPALPLFATAIGAAGLLRLRRKRAHQPA